MNGPRVSLLRPRLRVAIWRKRADVGFLLLVVILALGARLPYWRTIPAAGDEVGQAIYAYEIAQGQGLPLVGNDAYAGPFFFYLLALLFRLGIGDPLVGRTVVLVAGTLTAPVTYAWVRQLGGNRIAGLVAALLVAVNLHLILLNSHLGGSTFLLPFFTTAFLWLLSRAIDADSRAWLIASAVVAGLALQSNPVAGLLLVGGWMWATFRMRRTQRLDVCWPLWPLLGGLCVALVYSPVIIYNVSSRLGSVSTMGERSYLWQANPTIRTFFSNALRLGLQLIRQVSGVLMGEETIRSLVGLPMIYLAWMVAGSVYAVRRVCALPGLAVLPLLLAYPYFSSHYGMVFQVRFTSLLTPVFAASMGLLFAAVLRRVSGAGQAIGRWAVFVASISAVVLMASSFAELFHYYASIETEHLSGRALLALSRQMVEANRGERVYISSTGRMMGIKGIPYVPHAHLLFADIYQEFIPPEQIVGRLFEHPEPTFLLLSDEDAAFVGQVAALVPWPDPANEEAHYRGYGLYTLDVETDLVKPDYVLTGKNAQNVAPQVIVGVLLGGGVELMGYDAPTSISPGEALVLTFYWRAVAPLPPGRYIGFVHLIDPTSSLAAQDDHMLGQERYPLGAWQTDEVVVERYVLDIPEDAVPGRYSLRAGVYTWPDLNRLDISGHPDDIIELGSVDVVAGP